MSKTDLESVLDLILVFVYTNYEFSVKAITCLEYQILLIDANEIVENVNNKLNTLIRFKDIKMYIKFEHINIKNFLNNFEKVLKFSFLFISQPSCIINNFYF